MKTLKNLTLALTAAASLVACSASRTGTGSSSGTTGTSDGSTVDSATVSNSASNQETDSPTLGSMGSSTNPGSSTSVTDTSTSTGTSGSTDGGYASSGNTSISGSTNPGGAVQAGNLTNENSTLSSNNISDINNNPYSARTTGNVSAENFISQATQSGMKEVELSRLAQQKASNPKIQEFARMMIQQHSKKNQQLMSLASSKKISLGGALTATGAGSNTTGTLSGSGRLSGNNTSMGNSGTGSTLSGTRSSTDKSSNNTNTGVTITTGAGTTNTNPSASGVSTLGGISDQMSGSTGAGINATGTGSIQGTTLPADASATLNSSTIASGVNELQNLSGANFDRRYIQIMIEDHKQAVDLFTSAMQSNDSQVKSFASKTLPALRAHLYDAQQLNKSLSW